MSKLQVVVAYDYTPESELAVHRAIELGATWPDRHALHIVTVLDRDQDYHVAEQIRGDLLAHMHQRLHDNWPNVVIEFYAHARIGDPADEILDLAEEIGADMIIVGSHNRTTLGRFLLGSVSESVADRAGCTVVVARPKRYATVELSPVEEIPEAEHVHGTHRRAHRYSYTDGIALTRPDAWPIS